MTLHQQIINELQHIPEDKLAEIYDVIHYFRLGLVKEKSAEPQLAPINSTSANSIFEPQPESDNSVPSVAESPNILIGTKALHLAETLGFIGCLDAEPELSETYKAHLDWSDKT